MPVPCLIIARTEERAGPARLPRRFSSTSARVNKGPTRSSSSSSSTTGRICATGRVLVLIAALCVLCVREARGGLAKVIYDKCPQNVFYSLCFHGVYTTLRDPITNKRTMAETLLYHTLVSITKSITSTGFSVPPIQEDEPAGPTGGILSNYPRKTKEEATAALNLSLSTRLAELKEEREILEQHKGKKTGLNGYKLIELHASVYDANKEKYGLSEYGRTMADDGPHVTALISPDNFVKTQNDKLIITVLIENYQKVEDGKLDYLIDQNKKVTAYYEGNIGKGLPLPPPVSSVTLHYN